MYDEADQSLRKKIKMATDHLEWLIFNPNLRGVGNSDH